MTGFDADVAVLGGGPAGTTVANRLARMGYEVQLFEASAFPRRHVGESLHAQALSLFEQVGVREEMHSAGFLRPRGALVLWAGERRLRTDVANGFQVDRGRFDAILLKAAKNAGAQVAQPARVTDFTHPGAGSWRLTVTEGGTVRFFKCRFVVDASGRNGCLPGRRLRLQPPTIALYAYWYGADIGSDRGGDDTLIEACTDQWYWAAPLPDGSVNATVFVDPTRCKMTGGVNVTDCYLRLLRDSTLLSGCLDGRMATPVRACAAAASHIENPIGEDWMKIGEAAFTLDPLSSQGVQNAIMGGLQAAAVVNTILGYPECRTVAMKFCQDRLTEAAEQHAATTARFYRQQAAATPSTFWNARASGGLLNSNGAAPRLSRRHTPLVLDALLQVNPLASRQQTPALLEDRIVLQTALHVPGHRPAIWLEGQSLAELLEWPRHRMTARVLLESWSGALGSDRALRILWWLYDNGFLIRVRSETSDFVADLQSSQPNERVCNEDQPIRSAGQ